MQGRSENENENRIICAYYGAAALCAPAAFAAPETADTAPTIADAKAAVLVEYSTGKILYEMEADRRLPVASMTK